MKTFKRSTIINISIGAALLLLIIVAAGYYAVFTIETSKMSPVDTQELFPGFYAVKTNYVNFYLIKVNNGDKYIAIDAGGSASKAKTELQRLHISSDDVIAVFLTHTHADHVGALRIFDKASVYAGGYEPSKKASNMLADGETITVSDLSIQCMFTPGHSDDSVCYLLDNRYLFAGDTLRLEDNRVGLFHSRFNKSDDIQTSDIQRLSKLEGIRFIFSAHYGFTDNAVFP